MCTKLAKICKSWAPPRPPKKTRGPVLHPIFFFRLSCRWGHLISLHFHVNKNWRCWVGEWNRHEMQCINLSIYQQRTHHLGEFILIFDSAGPLQELFAQLKRTRSNWHTRHHYIDILYKKLLLFPVLLSTVMFRWWHFAAYDTDGFYLTHRFTHFSGTQVICCWRKTFPGLWVCGPVAEELGANLHQLKTDPKATKKRPERSLQTCQQKRVMIFS